MHPAIEKVAEKIRRHRLSSSEHQARAAIRSFIEYARDKVQSEFYADPLLRVGIIDYLTALLNEIEEDK